MLINYHVLEIYSHNNTNTMLHHFRLFYLCHEDTMSIKEESLINYLTWLCHTLSGLMIAMIVGENFFSVEQDSIVIISSCCKMPSLIFLENPVGLLHLYIIVHLILNFIGLVIQAAMFFKQKQLEEESAGQWIHHENGEIRLERKNLSTCNRKLLKHERNVISPLGSFLSFLISEVYCILATCMVFDIGTSGLPIICQFHLFSVHTLYFLVHNFIETMCSPTLRNTLLDVNNVLPWRRYVDHVVVVV